jgi:hypothetical protein
MVEVVEDGWVTGVDYEDCQISHSELCWALVVGEDSELMGWGG